MSDRTVRFHRVLRAKPERVYRAFVDAKALVKWLPPHGFVGEVFSMDARVGGGYHMAFTNLGTGQSHSFLAKYVELVPGAKIMYTDTFDDPSMPGAMMVTVTLEAVMCGTEMHIAQENIPAQIPLEMCYLGWQESLALLTQLVEAEIPEG